MNLINQNTIFIIIVMLLIVILPLGVGLVNFTVDDSLPDDYLQVDVFFEAWLGTPAYQVPSGLMMGMSMFALFVVYLSGWSSRRKFDDRSGDSLNFFKCIVSMTALFRAVFVFFFSHTGLFLQIKNKYLNKTSNPINDSQYEEVLNHAFHY